MTYDNWKTTEEPNEAADEAEATKQAQEEAEEEEARVMELAHKIAKLPLEQQLRLSVMVNEGLPLTLDHARKRIAALFPDEDFKIQIDAWAWNRTVADTKAKNETKWILFWFPKDSTGARHVEADSFDQLVENFAKELGVLSEKGSDDVSF